MEPEAAAIVNVTFRNHMAGTSLQNGSDIKWCAVEVQGDYKEFYETAQSITGLVIYPTAVFFGLLGNTLTIFVLSRRNMLTSTNAFLSALAVSDSIKLINDLLYFLVTLFFRTTPNLGNLAYGYLYPYAHFVFTLSVCVSSWLTVSVAIERYILVCHPTKARALWNRKRAVILCTIIYIIMTSLSLPSAFRYRTITCIDTNTNSSRLDVEVTEIWENELISTTYLWSQNLLRSIIPLLLLVVLNACIISALRRTKGKKRKNSRHRVTVMMLAVILVFLVCITPDAIMAMVFGFGYHEAGYLGKGFREITDSLLTINAGVNFIIYCACNQVFRKNFGRLCFSQKRQTNWNTELDESTYRRLSEAKSLLSSNNNSPPRTEAHSAVANNTSQERTIQNTNANRATSRCEATKELISNSNIGSSRQSVSSLTSCASSTDSHHNQHHSHHHHHRVSSSGLKKCRNSIKTNRAKKKSNVTFRDQCDSDKSKSKDKKTDNGEDDTTKLSPRGIRYNLCADNLSQFDESSLQISSEASRNSTSDAERATLCEELPTEACDTQQIAKFRSCDGSQILINTTQDINNGDDLNADGSDIDCIKDGAKRKKKKCKFADFSTSINDNIESNISSGNQTCDKCNVSFSTENNCVHINLISKESNEMETRSSSTDMSNINSMSDLTYVISSYPNGVILTTDL